MDDLKLLSQMRKDVPAPSQRAVNTALRRLAQATDGRRRSPLRGMAGTGSPGQPQRLRRLAVAGGLMYGGYSVVALGIRPIAGQ